ncbi:MAG: hypothetical protein ACRCYU_02470 [Nocardioides sp.]
MRDRVRGGLHWAGRFSAQERPEVEVDLEAEGIRLGSGLAEHSDEEVRAAYLLGLERGRATR